MSTGLMCVCVQWIQQIEGTEAALHQKMMDLELEMVSSHQHTRMCTVMCLRLEEVFHDVSYRRCSVNRRDIWKRSWTIGNRPWIRLTW